MGVEFHVDWCSSIESFVVVYRTSDYSFDVEPMPGGGIASLLVNDLQLEIANDGRVLYAWGYCPYFNWSPMNFQPTEHGTGVLSAAIGQEIKRGVSIRLTPPNTWRVFVDRESRWVCITESSQWLSSGLVVRFAADSLAILDGERLVGVCLRPVELPL